MRKGRKLHISAELQSLYTRNGQSQSCTGERQGVMVLFFPIHAVVADWANELVCDIST